MFCSSKQETYRRHFFFSLHKSFVSERLPGMNELIFFFRHNTKHDSHAKYQVRDEHQNGSPIVALQSRNPLSLRRARLTSHGLGRHHRGRAPGPACRHAGELFGDGGSLLGAATPRTTDGRCFLDDALELDAVCGPADA